MITYAAGLQASPDKSRARRRFRHSYSGWLETSFSREGVLDSLSEAEGKKAEEVFLGEGLARGRLLKRREMMGLGFGYIFGDGFCDFAIDKPCLH